MDAWERAPKVGRPQLSACSLCSLGGAVVKVWRDRRPFQLQELLKLIPSRRIWEKIGVFIAPVDLGMVYPLPSIRADLPQGSKGSKGTTS